ncbi:hypothetical protein ACHAPJ_008295 [Fusarium lateritium]
MQYRTPRGVIPAKVVEEQVREVIIDPKMRPRRNYYPHEYGNQELHGPNFRPYEQRNRPDQTAFYEVPVGSRMDLTRKSAGFVQIQNEQNVHPNDRGRVVRRDLNDPGPLRGIVAVDRKTGHNYGVAGVLYHPEGDVVALNRAAVEPLDRNGRQYLRRFADDSADTRRVTTWPPRDENSEELTTYDTRNKEEKAKLLRKYQQKQQKKQGGR